MKSNGFDGGRRCRATTPRGDDRPPALGPCCGCGTDRNVNTVIMLDGLCPTKGRGWGCMVCGLDGDGAVAVLCDECEEGHRNGTKAIAQICTGYPGVDGRTPISAMRGSHQHDMSAHVLADGGFGGED